MVTNKIYYFIQSSHDRITNGHNNKIVINITEHMMRYIIQVKEANVDFSITDRGYHYSVD